MIKTIYLNAGHSTIQSGVEIKGNQLYKTESELNMTIRDALVPELENNDFEVKIIPDDRDITESYKWVNVFASNINDGLALSIHNNCCGGEGAEAYYYKWNLKSRGMAKKLVNAYCKETRQKNRGAKSDTSVSYGQLGWIRKTDCWALLFECGFVDNVNDMDIMTNNIQRVARGLAKGVCAIYKIKYKELQLPTLEWIPTPAPERGEIKRQIIELVNKL